VAHEPQECKAPCMVCLQWVTDIMNHTAEVSLKWRTPLEVPTGQTTDTSVPLCHLFWDIVCITRHTVGQTGTEESHKIYGRFVGFSWNAGHIMTFKALINGGNILHCSQLRLAGMGGNNLKLDTATGAIPDRVHCTTRRQTEEGETVEVHEEVRFPVLDMTKSPFRLTHPIPQQKTSC
jgi:hypothetical protein